MVGEELASAIGEVDGGQRTVDVAGDLGVAVAIGGIGGAGLTAVTDLWALQLLFRTGFASEAFPNGGNDPGYRFEPLKVSSGYD